MARPAAVPLAGGGGLLAGAVTLLARLPADQAARALQRHGAAAILGVVLLFIVAGAWRRVNVYEAFVDGAKEGFGVAIQIVPYLIAILVVGAFRPPAAWMALLAPLPPPWLRWARRFWPFCLALPRG